MATCCENCKYGVDYGDMLLYIWCEVGVHKRQVRRYDSCTQHVPIQSICKYWHSNSNMCSKDNMSCSKGMSDTTCEKLEEVQE